MAGAHSPVPPSNYRGNMKATNRLQVVLSLLAFLPAGSLLEAQYLGGGAKTMAETQLADIETIGEKFGALAEAFPDSLYDWRPMEGVRSLRNVLVLVATESAFFPVAWGYDPPQWAAPDGFVAQQRLLQGISKPEITAEIVRAFEHVSNLIENMSDVDRSREVNFFGLDVDVATAITLMANDMHEHLGQSIAYARMNRIVPPWSR